MGLGKTLLKAYEDAMVSLEKPNKVEALSLMQKMADLLTMAEKPSEMVDDRNFLLQASSAKAEGMFDRLVASLQPNLMTFSSGHRGEGMFDRFSRNLGAGPR